MNKLLLGIALPISSLVVAGQDGSSSAHQWTGLLVAASCQAGTASSDRMPRKTPAASGEQNTTYEQTQNQAARAKTGTQDQMARTTDRGTSVTQSSDDALARTTTPPIDDKGTRGKATINNTPTDDAVKRAGLAPEADQAGPGRASSGGSDAEIAKGLDASCRVSQKTSAFALRLPNGSVVPFDGASNAKVAQQLQSGDRLQHKSKIFRAKVKGSLQSGAIAADSIQI